MPTLKKFDDIINEGFSLIDNEEHSQFIELVKLIMSEAVDNAKITANVNEDDYFDLNIEFHEVECQIVGLMQEALYPNAIFADWVREDKSVDIRGNESIKHMLADNYDIFIKKITNLINVNK